MYHLLDFITIAIVMTVNTYGYSNEWLTYVPKTGASGMGWLSVYIAYMGVYVLMMYTFDFARFGAKNDSEFHAKISFGTPFYLMAFLVNGLVGIFLITSGKLATISETGVVDQLILVLGEVLGLLFILITQTRINSANFYLATVNMQAFFEKIFGFHLKKWMWAIVVGIVVFAMMSTTDIFTSILTALNYQGIFVTAWVGIALTHILSKKYDVLLNGKLPYHLNEIPNFNPAGLIAWFTGVVAGLISTSIGFAYSPIVTFTTSIIVYLGMLSIAKREWYTTT